MNFCCVFPELKNFDLIKEVGLTPYFLANECDYNSTIVCFDNDEEYSNLDKVSGLNLEIIKKKYFINALNGWLIIKYIIKNANNIDVLNCFHNNVFMIIIFLVYKIINREGIIYHCMDMQYEYGLKVTGNCGIKYKLSTLKLRYLYKYLIDYGICENKKVFNLFINSHEVYGEKLGYMPIFIEPNYSINKKKKNQIISVGRIGAYEKASEIILEVFRNISNLHNNWILKMVGPISDDFKEYIDIFFNKYPYLYDSIIFTGNIENKDELYELYSESKIFLLPSRAESFGIVFVEALFYSNFLLVTDVGVCKYLIDISNFGKIVEIDNIEDISSNLIDVIENYENYSKNCLNLKDLVHNEFHHENYIKILDEKFKDLKNNKSKK